MSDTPESVLHRYFSAFHRHSVEDMAALLDEHVRGLYPAEPQRDWQGRKAAEALYRNAFSSWPDLKLEWQVEKLEPQPGSQAVAVYSRNRLSATGMERRVYIRYLISNGLISEVLHLE
jgi:hypothetical protein